MTVTLENPTTVHSGPVARVHLGRQVAIVAVAVVAYFGVRGATDASAGDAIRNAYLLVDLERALGIFHEKAWQDTLATPMVTTLLNWVYIWGHWPVIVATLIWLARTSPAIYYRTRNAMILSGAIGLVVFVLFPVAPPRLAELGMVDTVTQNSHAYRVLQPAVFTNQYAALPSLHVGWDLLMGIAIVVAARRAWLRAVGVAMPVAMVLSVVLTANHYFVDAVAGAALTTTCWILMRRREPQPVMSSIAR